MSGLSVTLAGQDISDLVDEFSLHGESILGQGPGAGSEGAGEASTFDLVADLAISSAKGAGQSRSKTYWEEVLSDLPASLYRMSAESTCRDVSGNGNHGTVISGPLQLAGGATGDKNPSWAPDGVSYVRLPLHAIGNPKNMVNYNQSTFEINSFPSYAFLKGSGSTFVRDNTAGTIFSGSFSGKWTTDGTGTFQSLSINIPSSQFVPGAQYTLSFYAKAASGTPSIRWFFEGNDQIAGNHSIGSVTTTAFTTTLTRYSVTATMPNPILDSYIGIRLDTGNTNLAMTLFIDGFQIEAGATATPFVTGGAVGVTQEALVFVENASASGPIRYTGTYATDGFGFGIGNGADWTTPGTKLIGRTDQGWVIPSSPVSLPVGVWSHVVAQWGTDGTLTFFVNSVPQAGTAAYGTARPTGFEYIGAASNGDRANNIQIDEVATYNAILAPTRLSAHYGAIGVAPVLIRQGEIVVKDANDAYVFGGFATNFDDATEQQALLVKTKISCHDYWQDLDRIEVNEVYTGRDDVYIIKDILTKYAPWISQASLPVSGTFTFGKRLVRGKSVKVALQKIAAVTGYLIWIGPDKAAHYSAPTDASSAPFDLSDSPNFSTSYSYDLLSYNLDENAIINRVYFYGGKQESPDFVQDLTPQHNGTNKVFLLAYYPHNASDGAIHVKKNGSDLTLGSPFDSGSTGKLIADGGTAQVLINHAAETLTFDASVLSGVTTLTCTYRYNTPLVIVVSDKSSQSFYGRYYDGKLDDQSVLDAGTAIQRSRVLLAQQSYGLVKLQVLTWKSGLQAGQLLRLINSVQGLNSTYQVQKVTVDPLGSGAFQYTVDLGAWNWSFTDLLMATARRAGVQDEEDGENQQVVQAQQFDQLLHAVDVWSRKTGTSGVYYSRNAPVNDGADAYCGFCTITS